MTPEEAMRLTNGCNFAIILPPKETYCNLHPTCIHLFEIPVPLAVGGVL